jgi:tetrahydromethanopterin S-methyltransferase subunit G
MSEKEHCLKEREWGELSVEIATIKKDVKETKDEIKVIHNKIDELPDRLKNQFASKERFELVEKAVYSTIGLICFIVISAVVYLVVRGGQ